MGKKIALKDFLENQGEANVETLSFEEGLQLLEELVNSVENGDLPLERSITSYERGTALLGHLRKTLAAADEKLKLVGASGTVTEIEV